VTPEDDGRLLLAVPGLQKAGWRERDLLWRIADRNHWDPNYLAAAISHESGWNPQAKNPGSTATGLIQFMAFTARTLGTTVERIARMSMFEQLPLVERFFQKASGSRQIEPRDFLVYSLGPAACLEGGLRDACVLFPAGSAGSVANPGLQDADGAIRVRRVRQALDSIISKAVKRDPLWVAANHEWATTGRPSLASAGEARPVLAGLVASGLGGLALWALTRYLVGRHARS
jgi:hypothetical protein